MACNKEEAIKVEDVADRQISGTKKSPLLSEKSTEPNGSRDISNSHSTVKRPIVMLRLPAGCLTPSLLPDSVGNMQPTASGAAASKKSKRKHEQDPASAAEARLRRKNHILKKKASAGSLVSEPEANRQKKRCINEHRLNNGRNGTAQQRTSQNGGSCRRGSVNDDVGIGTVRVGGNNKLAQTRESLLEKAKKAIQVKMKKWSSLAAVVKTSEKDNGKREKEMEKGVVIGAKSAANRCPESKKSKLRLQFSGSTSVKDVENLKIRSIAAVSMCVPDPDFHNFDKDRTKRSFGKNQVWAAYDDDDGMPRYYAMIHGVVSHQPFKMRISWLNSKSSREFGPMNWIGSGFRKSSGEFRVGKHEGNNSINAFSHKVNWSKGLRGTILIYPRKGDVWALYRDWSPDWNEYTSNDIIHKYEMVEVLEDYKEDVGVTVAPLVKAVGYKTVFCRHPDSSKTRTFPKEEMFRLSHQVPYRLLTGQEGCNVPKGCWELDPASLPLELLEVLTEVQVEEMRKAAENAEENDPSGDQKRYKGKQPAGSAKTAKVMEDAEAKGSGGENVTRLKGTKDNRFLVYRRRKKFMQFEHHL